MKTISLIICILISVNSFGQRTVKDTIPDLKMISRTTGKEMKNTEIKILGNPEFIKQKPFGYFNMKPHPSFKGHWAGFNYGFINFANVDYSIYAPSAGEFMELSWSNSFSMQFNLFDYSINLVPRNNFGFVTGIGLEYQRFKFENQHISIQKNEQGMIVPMELEPLGITNVKRNTLKALYLTIPLLLEFQFPARKRERLYVSGGVMGGVKMHSKTKIVYNDTEGEKHKKKNSDNFNMVPFKADVVGKIGYRTVSVWGSYTLTNMFKSGKGPELHAYTVGIGLTY